MARSAKLGVKIQAKDETKQALNSLRGGLSKAQTKLSALTAINAAQFFAQISQAVSRAVGRLSEFAGEADRVAKAGKRIGLTAESMSQLGFAAEQSGNSVAEMRTAMTALTRRASAMPATFEKWGISVRDANGEIKSSDTLLNDVANRTQNLSSAADRAALAQDLMSESGRKLVPMLAGGAAGIQALRDEADELGITISSTEAKLSEEFNDAVNRMNQSLAGAGRAIAKEFLPYVTQIAGLVTEAAKQVGQWVQANRELMSSGLQEFFAWMAESAIPAILVGANMLQTAFGGLEIIFTSIKVAAQAFLVGLLSTVEQMVDAAIGAIGVFNSRAAAEMRANPVIDGFKKMSVASTEVLRKFAGEYDKIVAEIKSNDETLANIGAVAAEKIGGLRNAIALGAPEKPTVAPMSGVQPGPVGDKKKEDAPPGVARQVFDPSLKAAAEKARAEKSVLQAQEKSVLAMGQFAGQMTGPMSSALTGMIFQGKSAADSMKSLATTVAQLVIQQTIKSLLGTFLPIPGFSTGGLVGGPAGHDRVPAMLTAGEYVLPKGVVDSIRGGKEPMAAGSFSTGGLVAAGGGGGGSVNVTIQTVAPPDSSTIRNAVSSGLLPVINRVERNRTARSTSRKAGSVA